MYKKTATASISRLSDGAVVPADPSNADWQEYQAWLEAGNTPQPADPVVPAVPQVVSRFQARAALHLAGLLVQVQGVMDNPATEMLARLAWQDALELRRMSPTVLNMGAALGLNAAQLDALFVTAAGIEA